MAKQIGTFSTEGAFHITGRGWVVVGSLAGQAASGSQLVFDNGIVLHVVGVQAASTYNAAARYGLLIAEPFATRQEIVSRGLLEVTARILA